MLTNTFVVALLVILLSVLGLGLVWFLVGLWRTPLTAGQYLLYVFNAVYTRVMWGAKVNAALDLETARGAVIVCNHTSSVDTCFVQLAAGQRVVHWMVAKEYFSMPVFGYLLRLVECIPANRGGVDTAVMKLSIRYAQSGRLIGLFPEGRINTTDQLLLPGRPGAALLAIRAQVPVIPCFVEGVPYKGTVLSSLFMRAKVRLHVGKPIDLSPYYGRQKEPEVLNEVTRLLLKEIATLAGHPEFEPEVAGRNWKRDGEAASATPPADPASET